MLEHFKIETATQRFYREVKTIKPLLPKDWKMQLIKKLPLYDSYRGGVVIHNVINCRATDVDVLDALKEIVTNPALTLSNAG